MLDLSIVIITYNREKYLRRLLESLSRSVFRDCEIWILNNASTDGTLHVCEQYKMKLSGLTVISHKFNIGGEANVLRAYEYGNKTYKWILCDDDVLHLGNDDELVDALRCKKYDIIRVGDVGVLAAEHGRSTTLGELLHDPQSLAFYSLGFIPNLIFRNVVGGYLRLAYQKIHTCYPQLFVLMKAFNVDAHVYTTKSPLLTRGDAIGGNGCEIVLYQIRSLEALPTRKGKRIAMSWRSRQQNLFLFLFGFAILILGDLKRGVSRRAIFGISCETIMAAPFLSGKLLLAINSLFILFPRRYLFLLSKLYRSWNKKLRLAMPYDE